MIYVNDQHNTNERSRELVRAMPSEFEANAPTPTGSDASQSNGQRVAVDRPCTSGTPAQLMSSDFAPDPPSLTDKNTSRSGRKRKARNMGNLSQCLCEDTVSLTQIEASAIEVVQCKKAGCETEWVMHSS